MMLHVDFAVVLVCKVRLRQMGRNFLFINCIEEFIEIASYSEVILQNLRHLLPQFSLLPDMRTHFLICSFM
jgi:hypothetical protein